jgi:putative DNA primase/helicase
MAAVVQRPDGVEIAVQRTFLTADGNKADVGTMKLTTGNLGTGAVRLGYAAEVMGIAEGVETALSARFLSDIPVWASLGAHRLPQIELPSILREVHIFADNDDTGRKYAALAAKTHPALGREVRIHFPRKGLKDFNDVIVAEADVSFT